MIDVVRRVAKLEADLAKSQKAVEELSKSYHEAINEPEYAGTRQDWMHRALSAEEECRRLRKALLQLSNEIAATLSISEPELRTIAGNTNVNCLKSRLEASRAVLSGERGKNDPNS
jgi:hypothetical protein